MMKITPLFFFYALLLLLSLPCGKSEKRCPLSIHENCDNVTQCHDFILEEDCECNWERTCQGKDICIDYGVCADGNELMICESGCYGCHDLDGSLEYLCLCDPAIEDTPPGSVEGICPNVNATCQQQYEFSFCYSPPDPACLSGYSVVDIKSPSSSTSRISTFLQDVAEGDDILVSKGEGEGKGNDVYETVYAFGHKDVYAAATFLQFHTTKSTASSPLELSADHLIYIISQGNNHVAAVRADSVQVGDLIMSDDPLADDDVEVVLEITRIARQGIFSPLTPRGSFLANGGLQVSSYTAVPYADGHDEYLALSSSNANNNHPVVTWITHHYLNHIAMGPLRFLCTSGGDALLQNVCYQRNDQGQILLAAFADNLLSGAIHHTPIWIQYIITAALFVSLVSFHALEQYYIMLIVAPILFLVYWMFFQAKKRSC